MNLTIMSNVITLNEYVAITQQLIDTEYFKNKKVNMSSTLFIIKNRSLEMEYCDKYHQIGAGGILFECLLSLPPSKLWGLKNNDLVGTLQFWLQSIKKHLLKGNIGMWWKYLKHIFKLIKDICGKHPNMPNTLVDLTSETFLILASFESFSPQQRYEVLHCFNMFCAESRREVRQSLRTKFTQHFTALAHQLSSCGFLPLQYSALETLMRWLVPRDLQTLAPAAARWFPPERCDRVVRELFVKSTWANFFQDARKFLNVLNTTSGNHLVASVMCKRLHIGQIAVVSGEERLQYWVDINMAVSSLSVLIDPRSLNTIQPQSRTCETLLVEAESTKHARLHSETGELTLEVRCEPMVRPSGLSVSEGRDVTVTYVISSRTDVGALNAALTAVFQHKYEMAMDINTVLRMSPSREINRRLINSSSEESRFSHPDEMKRKKIAAPGVVYRSLRERFMAESLKSPSTDSTSSLAQLQDKLTALPQYGYQRSKVSICRSPKLSSVSEISEDTLHSRSTIKLAPFDVGVKTFRQIKLEINTEPQKDKNENSRQSVANDYANDTSTSVLTFAAFGNDDSIIKDTAEQIEEENFQHIDIVDLLVKALNTEAKEKHSSVGNEEINRKEADENSEAIENTPINDFKITNKIKKKRPYTVIKSTTEDESNTESIDTIVTTRRNTGNKAINAFTENTKESKDSIFEKLHSRHDFNDTDERVNIDPKCLSKDHLNNTSTIEIRETVSNDKRFKGAKNKMAEKSTDNNDIDNDNNSTENDENVQYPHINNDIVPLNSKTNTPNVSPNKILKANEHIKLKYVTNRKQVTKKTKKSVAAKKVKETIVITPPKPDDKIAGSTVDPIANEQNKTPLADNLIARRKRKLYSPTDDEIKYDTKDAALSDSEDDNINLAAIKSHLKPKVPITKNKQKEQRMQFLDKKPRANFSKTSSHTTSESDAVFDKLKETMENTDKFKYVNRKSNTDVYNFSSGSEDSDFVKSKVALSKRINKKATASSEASASAQPVKRRTRRNYIGKRTDSDVSKTIKNTVTKKANRNKKPQIKTNPVSESDVEIMRDAGQEDVLNTSLTTLQPFEEPKNPTLTLHNPPQMELIIDEPETAPEQESKNSKKKKATPIKIQTTKENPDNDDSGTLSPLPGLIISQELSTRKDDTMDFNFTAMELKFHEIYQELPEANDTTEAQNKRSPPKDKNITKSALIDQEKCYSTDNIPVNTADTVEDEGKVNLPQIETTTNKKRKLKKKVQKKGTNTVQVKKEKLHAKQYKNESTLIEKHGNNVEDVEIAEVITNENIQSEIEIVKTREDVQIEINVPKVSEEDTSKDMGIEQIIEIPEEIELDDCPMRETPKITKHIQDKDTIKDVSKEKKRDKDDAIEILDEIIQIPSKAKKNTSKIPNKNKVNKINDKDEVNVTNSESNKSISSRHIYANDSEKAPPSPTSLEKSVSLREPPNINKSMRDYFILLNRELYSSTYNKTNLLENRVPIVALTPLSRKELEKYSTNDCKSDKRETCTEANSSERKNKHSLKITYDTRTKVDRAKRNILNNEGRRSKTPSQTELDQIDQENIIEEVAKRKSSILLDYGGKIPRKNLNVENNERDAMYDIEDWFQRNEHSKQDMNALINDTIKSTKETLEITISENNENTKNMMMDILMDVKAHVSKQKERIVETVAKAEAAAKAAADAANALRRSKNESLEFVELLTKKVTHIVGQNHTQKLHMLNTVVEDIEAALGTVRR